MNAPSSTRCRIFRTSIFPILILIGLCGSHQLLPYAADFLPRLHWLENAMLSGASAVIFWWFYGVLRIMEAHLTQTAQDSASRIDDFLYPLIAIGLRALVPVLLVSTIFLSLSLPKEWEMIAQKTPPTVLVLALGWVLYKAVTISERAFLNSRPADIGFEYRSVITRVRLLRRIAIVLVVFFVTASILTLFDQVRSLGTSLLASAGVAGIVLGLAAQRTFGNIFAGIQIAFTQPIRLGDQINVENEAGTVEEITLTYVVVKLWDLRRLVLPISYFIERPFQNLSRTSTNVVGTVMLRVDFSAPVQVLREHFGKIVENSKHWNQGTYALHVSDSDDVSLQLRLTASAPTAGQAWELRCEIREKMIDFLRREHPHALPRARNEQKAIEDWDKAVNTPT
jgi:small-conductance mechanosensitive channel